VGFRPFVYRLARELALGGYVCNDARGVVIEAEGAPGAIQALTSRLTAQAPPLARIECVEREPRAVTGCSSFEIRGSATDGRPDAAVAVDSATCADCLRELFDSRDRRYRYPFINCTNCGPRFTIVRGVPYDRAATTMAGFVMCPECRAEYEDPGNRRFHAQPNACPRCGPALSLTPLTADAPPIHGDPVAAAARAMRAGAIVAVKGLGGYHLACRADSELAVATLRARKHREDKPFALMVADLRAAAGLVELGAAERRLLTDLARPIVLARRRPGAAVAAAVAPASTELGVMLPYSPLHHLLLADVGVTLVMTSGNASDEPIAYRDDDARERLGAVADLILSHDRPIETRTDDSVVRAVKVGGAPQAMVLRRSRGYVPASLSLPDPGSPRPLLACGAELKSTFCLARDRHAWVSHHIGDLGNYETLRSFTEGIAHFSRLFAVAPELAVHDVHPDYLSTQYARERADLELVAVQHHHAHLAACLAEHGERGPAVGAIFDGTGYGCDGTVWGGELLYGDLCAFERAGALRPVRMPGGTQAIRQPWRMACAWLAELAPGEPAIPRSLAERVQPAAWSQVLGLARSGIASPVTSSMGRLFDAVAALVGIRAHVTYEGQAAVELEACCEPARRGAYPFEVVSTEGRLTLDPEPALRAIVRDIGAGERPGAIAARFHAAVATATAAASAQLATARGADTVVLAGGVFANRVLLERTAGQLRRSGLRVLVPRALPPGDGAISYGQAAVAAARESQW
jgi:hydrogenase maturation protein HypF